MRNIGKIILLSLAGIAGIILFGVLIFLFNLLRSVRSMTPAETGMINDSVWCIKDHFTDAYIFKGKTGYLLVDAGIGKKNFNEELRKLGLKPHMINNVLLTNIDADNTGALSLFKNAIVYMNLDEIQYIDGKKGKTRTFRPKWNKGPYTSISNNDTITIDGLKIKLILAPGHAAGSSCYIIGNNYFISGDNLIIKKGRYIRLASKANIKQQKESLKTFPDPKSYAYVLTSHNGIVRNESKAADSNDDDDTGSAQTQSDE